MTAPDTPTPDAASGSLREQKKQHTRAAIHEAAIALVMEHGLGGVTTEEICARAEISPRTFFNYFPSKMAAVIGLDAPSISDENKAAFLAGNGKVNLVPDLCVLMAQAVPTRRPQIRDLIEKRPELAGAIHTWMVELREAITATTAERVDLHTARLAVSLVLSAAMELVKSSEGTLERAGLAEMIHQNVHEMVELVEY